MHHERQQNLNNMLTPELRYRVEAIRESWADVRYQHLADATNNAEQIEPTAYTSRAIILDPLDSDVDESHTIVLGLPHLNGWTPHHFVRARVTQQVVAPHSRMVVLPNNSFDQKNYNLSYMSEQERQDMKNGSLLPFGEHQIRTIAQVNKKHRLGDLKLTGYSLGGRVALAMAAENADLFNITHVNADEVPSKTGRSSRQLQKDFMKSGGAINQHKSIREAGIPVYNSALRLSRISVDLAKFALQSQRKDAALMTDAMSGDAKSEAWQASGVQCSVKIGYVQGSKIFEPEPWTEEWSAAETNSLVQYFGRGFNGHPSGDNVIYNALMARQGLNR